ncbi:hypothetical protein TNCV_4134021 [Trichonephila clavipes]|nr:hypothetical protein TNCV_4134021 [Trichonephila clavipes]
MARAWLIPLISKPPRPPSSRWRKKDKKNWSKEKERKKKKTSQEVTQSGQLRRIAGWKENKVTELEDEITRFQACKEIKRKLNLLSYPIVTYLDIPHGKLQFELIDLESDYCVKLLLNALSAEKYFHIRRNLLFSFDYYTLPCKFHRRQKQSERRPPVIFQILGAPQNDIKECSGPRKPT